MVNSQRSIVRYIVFLFVLLSGTVHAQPIDKEMYAKVVGMNQKRNCPFEEEGLVVKNLSYKAGYLHFTIDMEDVRMFGRDTAELKEFCADRLRYRLEPAEFQYLYEKLNDIRGGFVYDFTLDSSRCQFSLRYTPEETRKILADRKKPEYQNSEQWEARYYIFVQTYLDNLYDFSERVSDEEPINIDSARIQGETLTYYISTSNQQYSTYYENRDSWREFFRNMFYFDTPDAMEALATAGYHFLAIYENVARTDSFHIYFPNDTLVKMNELYDHFEEADDQQVDAYLRKAAQEASDEWKQLIGEHSDSYTSLDFDYRDGFLQLTLMVKEGEMNFNSTPKDLELLRNALGSSLKHSFESSLESPDIINDTIIISLGRVYQRLKGFQIIYMEENTRKTIDFTFHTIEIQNAKLPVVETDELTQEKIQEQLLAERYANELAQYSRELCPIKSGEVWIDSLVYDYENLHYYGRTSPDYVWNSDSAEMKATLRTQFAFATTESSLFTTLIKLKGGLIVHYYIPRMDTVVSIFFSYEEMVKTMNAGDSLSERERALGALNNIITNTNKQLPALIDFMTRLDSLSVDGNQLVYHYTILSQFEKAKENLPTMRWLLASQFSAEDAGVQYLINLCVHCGYGICYRYEPLPADKKPKKKSKKQKVNDRLDICFSVKELEGYVKD